MTRQERRAQEYHRLSAERDKYKAQRDELTNTLKTLFNLIEIGVLVRNMSKDDDPKWYLKALELTSALVKAKAAIQDSL